MHTSSIKSFKSFHAKKKEKKVVSPREAATLIQRTYRRYACEKTYKLNKNKKNSVFLFKSTFQGAILTCEMIGKNNYVTELRFCRKGEKDLTVTVQLDTMQVND